MSPILGFVLFLVITLSLLGLTVWTGRRARRKPHLCFVACSVSALAVTIYYAEALGETLDLKAAGRIYPVHLFIAKSAVLAYLLPVVSGIRTLRNPQGRKLHGRIAFFVLGLTALTAVTGIWMVLASEPLPS